jgi:hypothetical protein
MSPRPSASTRRRQGRSANAETPPARQLQGSELLTLVFAAILGIFGIVIFGGVLIGAIERTSRYSPATDLLLSLLFGVLPLVWGLILYRRVRRAVAQRRSENTEAAVLRVAQERGGLVTAVDVAAGCGTSLEEAQKALDGLHLRGFCDIDVADSGTITFRFRL